VAGEVTIETTTGLNPNDPVEPIAKQIKNSREDTLLVGHMTFMGRLAAHLLTGNSSAEMVGFEPGSMLCLERDESGHWAISWMIKPGLFT
jgi:phosphohistidine phosphatase